MLPLESRDEESSDGLNLQLPDAADEVICLASNAYFIVRLLAFLWVDYA